MAKQVKKVSKVKVKKKRWFPIFAPSFMGQKEIGESYLGEAEQAVGRVMKVNLRELTGSMKDQNIYVSLKIAGVKGNNLQTEVVGYAYMPFFLRKMVRKNAGRVDDSFVLETKEGKKVRLKPLVATVFKINNSTKTEIRKRVREMFKEEVNKNTFDSLITDLLRYRLQMEFKKRLQKLCPVREVLMRRIKIEEGKKVKVTDIGDRSPQGKEEQIPQSSSKTETSSEAETIKVSERVKEVKKEEVKKEVPPTQPSTTSQEGPPSQTPPPTQESSVQKKTPNHPPQEGKEE